MAGLKAGFARLMDMAALIGSVVIASLLWTALAVFLLSLPAATAALFHAVGQAIRGGAENPVQDFVTGLLRHYRTATLVGLPGLLLGLVLGVDAVFLIQQPSQAVQIAGYLFASLFFLWFGVWLTFWPVLVIRQEGWRQGLRLSFWLSMARLPWTALTVGSTVLLVLMSVAVPWLIPFAPGLSALMATAITMRSLRRYDLM